jgi:hypothetical protein
MKLHVTSHQWHNRNNNNNLTPHPTAKTQLMLVMTTTIVLDVYSHCLKALHSCIINYYKVMDGHDMALATMTMLVTSGNKQQVFINYVIM